VLAAILFAISVVGIFLNRRNLIVLLMAIELMLLAVNLNFIAFSYFLGNIAGQVFVFFILTVRQRSRRSAWPSWWCCSATLAASMSKIWIPEGMKQLAVIVAFAPLLGALVAGLGGRWITRQGAHSVTIFSVLLSFLASCVIFVDVLKGASFNETIYTWLTVGDTRFHIGFLIDRLTALMMVVVTFVSLMVHVYTIGYMADDPATSASSPTSRSSPSRC